MDVENRFQELGPSGGVDGKRVYNFVSSLVSVCCGI